MENNQKNKLKIQWVSYISIAFGIVAFLIMGALFLLFMSYELPPLMIMALIPLFVMAVFIPIGFGIMNLKKIKNL